MLTVRRKSDYARVKTECPRGKVVVVVVVVVLVVFVVVGFVFLLLLFLLLRLLSLLFVFSFCRLAMLLCNLDTAQVQMLDEGSAVLTLAACIWMGRFRLRLPGVSVVCCVCSSFLCFPRRRSLLALAPAASFPRSHAVALFLGLCVYDMSSTH